MKELPSRVNNVTRNNGLEKYSNKFCKRSQKKRRSANARNIVKAMGMKFDPEKQSA